MTSLPLPNRNLREKHFYIFKSFQSHDEAVNNKRTTTAHSGGEILLKPQLLQEPLRIDKTYRTNRLL